MRNLPQPKSNFRSLPPSIAGAAGLEQILRGQFAKLDGESLNSATTSKPLVSRIGITLFQFDPSSKAPWTGTTLRWAASHGHE